MGSSEKFCEVCDCHVVGITAWNQHLESKGHRKREITEGQFTFNAEDVFLDDDSPVMQLANKFKFPMIGLECIVEDRTCAEIKCTLCRIILKTTSFIDHVKSYKHQQLYLQKSNRGKYRQLQLKCAKRGDLSSEVPKRCETLVRRYGRQKIRTYEKGYAEKRKLLVRQNRLKEATQVSTDIAANVDDFEELPKNERVMQLLADSKQEPFQNGESAFVNDVVKHIHGPVVGLEFVAEYRDSNYEYEPGYLCRNCESLLNTSQLVAHIVTDKHRLKYLELYHRDKYSLVTFKNFTKERQKELLTKYCGDIENANGRGEVTQKLIISAKDTSSLFRYHKRIKIGAANAASNVEYKMLPKTTVSDIYGSSYVQQPQVSAMGAYQLGGTSNAAGNLLPKTTASVNHGTYYAQQGQLSATGAYQLGAASNAVNNLLPKTTASVTHGIPHVLVAKLSAKGAFQRPETSGSLLPSLISSLGASGQQAATLAFQNTSLPSSNAQQPRVSGTAAIQAGLAASSSKFIPVPPAGTALQQLQPTEPARSIYDSSTAQSATYSSMSASYEPPVSTARAIASLSGQTRKPTHVYSEKTEQMVEMKRKTEQENKIKEMQRHVPPYRQYNLESGWYSERAYSVDYFVELVAPLNLSYISIRYPNANPNLYSDFSPYLMRLLQDQFNFDIEHLAWLTEQFISWHTPMYEPLTSTDLRPLQDDVEEAVLNVLLGRVLKTASGGKKRVITTDYPSPENSNFAVGKDEKEIFLYDYCHGSADEEPPAKKFKRSEWIADVAENSLREFSNSGDSAEESTLAEESTRAPSPAVENPMMMTVCAQILETARSASSNNDVVRLLLSFEKAEKVLYNVAVKDSECLSRIIYFAQNPTAEISNSTLNEFNEIFTRFSKI